MSMLDNARLMARYNRWMNAKLYETAAKLPQETLEADRKAFFKSIVGTLNHIVVADILWLKRFAALPSEQTTLEAIRRMEAPTSLDQILYQDFNRLAEHRRMLDAIIIAWADGLNSDDFDRDLSYRSMKGIAANKPFSILVMHFFNHQTHHRGQASTLLSQEGLDMGPTDLLAMAAT